MRGEFKDINYGGALSYDISRGLFFDDNDVYLVEAFSGNATDFISVKLSNSSGTYTAKLENQPKLHGVGIQEALSLSSESPELPETDEGIEAYARYVLQSEEDLGAFEYDGTRDLEDIF